MVSFEQYMTLVLQWSVQAPPRLSAYPYTKQARDSGSAVTIFCRQSAAKTFYVRPRHLTRMGRVVKTRYLCMNFLQELH